MTRGGEETEIGEKKRFIPSGFSDYKDPAALSAVIEVTGTVVEIHEEHRWYRVEYFVRERGPYYECFKF